MSHAEPEPVAKLRPRTNTRTRTRSAKRSGRGNAVPRKSVATQWTAGAFFAMPTVLRQISPTALGITIALHLLLLLPLARVLLKDESTVEARQTPVPQVELVPPPFVQINPFANQEHVDTEQEGAQNQRAAQEADPDLQSPEQGPQLEGEDPKFNRIISGVPDAPDTPPAPTPLWASADLPEGSGPPVRPATAASKVPLALQTRREAALAEAATPPAQRTEEAQTAEATPAEPQPSAPTSPAPAVAAAPQTPHLAPLNLPRVLETSLPAQAEGLPAADIAQLDSPALPEGEEQMPAPTPTTPTLQHEPDAAAPLAAPLTPPQSQTAATPQPTAEAVETPTAQPVVDPGAPRPRPVLQPRISAGPLRHQAAAASRRGVVAIDSKFSEFGAYQQRMVEAISAQWYLLARQSRAIDSEYGTQVVLRFKMSDQGIVSDTEVRFTNASAAATLLCINAVESRSPFGLWNSQMQRVLGKEQTITFTFYYR